MNVLDAEFVKGFMRMADDGWRQGWHERNGGNLSYRIRPEEVESVREELHPGEWKPIGTSVPKLGGEYFLVTGSGKFMRNVTVKPADSFCIIELDQAGENYRICWGLVNGGRPTSELPTHLMNHEVKFTATGGRHRVIYHAHPANTIALTFELMKKYDVAIWAHHGMFCSGEDFDLTFGLMHTVEKSAEILVKVRSMQDYKRQTITPDDFRHLAKDFGVKLPKKFLFEK